MEVWLIILAVLASLGWGMMTFLVVWGLLALVAKILKKRRK